MKLSPILLAGAFSFGVSALEPVQNPARDLRVALGGEAALDGIKRLHITAKFTSTMRGNGESEAFLVLPDRFLEKSHGVYRYTSPVAQYHPYPQLTAGMNDISLQETDTQSEVGFRGDEPFVDLRVGRSKEEARDRSLRGARFAFAKWMIPLFGGSATVTSSFRETGSLLFQDRDQTAWTLTLDPASRPATLSWERSQLAAGEMRYTPPLGSIVVTSFSDFRPVKGGPIWPYQIVTTRDGQPFETIEIKSYEINGKAPKVLLK